VAGIATTLRTVTLAEDRLVNKPHLSIALQPQSGQFNLYIAVYLTLLIEKPLEIISKLLLKVI
jgi:hypothetical protein